jgi:pimeloyl-ACP methyl ester carboxylesterase
MKHPAEFLSSSFNVAEKTARILEKRLELAGKRLGGCIEKTAKATPTPVDSPFDWPWRSWVDSWQYAIDLSQRSILFWDVLRQRGDNFLAHERAGKPPVLHFEYETVLDARTFEEPVNYALLRIIPPVGVKIDPTRRPYIIIDPRAGHGPGIGGFKDDSQVGVALREGHPVYFVIFYPEPMPGQTLLDVCRAEARFVHRVRELHPQSAKPVIVGNCQGGWVAMMLAAANPEDTGPIVINGAPMSYWGGAWSEGEGDNPMRYAGGLLGGSWLASLASDLGNGKFDGVNLVQNMENLNPANTFWDKYYHLFANVDTEGPRFLDFERWWGGFYLLNREEIDWIVQNLFVGNRLWETNGTTRGAFDLREIKAPIVLFASLGDNITPPQQAFNWVADTYESTDEIKACGQTIVGLLHQDIGHLGIFVSGKVAKKEHAQIVSVLKSIEALPAGLYGMKIIEQPGAGKDSGFTVEFVEYRLEDVTKKLNRFGRSDEKAFEATGSVSDFFQRAYDLFVSPMVKATANEPVAELGRKLHPLRAQRWIWSSENPMLRWLKPAAEAVREMRREVPADQGLRRAERLGSDLLSASFDYYRDVRDAVSEALFFTIYGNLFSLYPSDKPRKSDEHPRHDEGRNAPYVRDALTAVETGGFPEAVARAGALLARRGEPLPLSRLQLRKELLSDYKDLLPDLPADAARRIRGEQDVIVSYERDRAIETLPNLLAASDDRERFLSLLERLVADPRIQADGVTPEQEAMLGRIRSALAANVSRSALRPVSPHRPSDGTAGSKQREGVRR